MSLPIIMKSPITKGLSKYIEIEAVLDWVRTKPFNEIDGITISGGEPFEQPEALYELLNKLKALFHGQKIDIKSIKVKDKVLTIKGSSKVDTTLEEWNFSRKAVYFQDVFGIEPVLRISKEV